MLSCIVTVVLDLKGTGVKQIRLSQAYDINLCHAPMPAVHGFQPHRSVCEANRRPLSCRRFWLRKYALLSSPEEQEPTGERMGAWAHDCISATTDFMWILPSDYMPVSCFLHPTSPPTTTSLRAQHGHYPTPSFILYLQFPILLDLILYLQFSSILLDPI